MTDPTLQAALLDDPQPLLGATMWLMSRFTQAPCPVVAQRVVENLGRIANHPHCDDALSRMCATMAAQWARNCLRAQHPPARPDARGAADAPDAPDAAARARLH